VVQRGEPSLGVLFAHGLGGCRDGVRRSVEVAILDGIQEAAHVTGRTAARLGARALLNVKRSSHFSTSSQVVE
jgi:hypothetical protein